MKQNLVDVINMLLSISLIYVFQFMKQNILFTLFDDFHKTISEI